MVATALPMRLVIARLRHEALAFAGAGYSTSVAGFMLMRFLLGLGEAGNFPAAIRTVAEWFPQRERALATGIFNSGTNVGALVVPLVVPWLTLAYGWAWAFILTGLVGFVWLLLWWWLYAPADRHRWVTAAELAHIRRDPADADVSVSWRRILPHRQPWAFAAGKFLTDPVWWLYIFWIPDFFSRNYGLDLTTIGPPVVVVYLLADVGSVGGGWISSRLIRRGWSVNAARKTAMLICALGAVPVVAAPAVQSLWLAVGIVGLAAAAHQGWSWRRGWRRQRSNRRAGDDQRLGLLTGAVDALATSSGSTRRRRVSIGVLLRPLWMACMSNSTLSAPSSVIGCRTVESGGL